MVLSKTETTPASTTRAIESPQDDRNLGAFFLFCYVNPEGVRFFVFSGLHNEDGEKREGYLDADGNFTLVQLCSQWQGAGGARKVYAHGGEDARSTARTEAFEELSLDIPRGRIVGGIPTVVTYQEKGDRKYLIATRPWIAYLSPEQFEVCKSQQDRFWVVVEKDLKKNMDAMFFQTKFRPFIYQAMILYFLVIDGCSPNAAARAYNYALAQAVFRMFPNGEVSHAALDRDGSLVPDEEVGKYLDG